MTHAGGGHEDCGPERLADRRQVQAAGVQGELFRVLASELAPVLALNDWLLLAARSSIHALAAHCQRRICIPSAAAPSLHRQQTLHVPDFDFNTNCILLTDCLAEVKRWSGAVQGVRSLLRQQRP